jgi:DNA-directed RNA polymerase subunit L
MDYKVVDKGKNFVEVEVSDKALPNAILPILHDEGVDAYAYDPHPLKLGYRLRITADNPERELRKAVDRLSKDWKGFRKAVVEKVPKR